MPCGLIEPRALHFRQLGKGGWLQKSTSKTLISSGERTVTFWGPASSGHGTIEDADTKARGMSLRGKFGDVGRKINREPRGNVGGT